MRAHTLLQVVRTQTKVKRSHKIPRSDLVITDTETGHRHCLDVTFTDPSAKVNMAGANPSTSAGLERLYKAQVQRYAHICAQHTI